MTIVNFEKFLGKSNDGLLLSRFDSNGNLISQGVGVVTNLGINKYFSFDAGHSVDIDTLVDTPNINSTFQGGGRFGDTRYIDNVGTKNDLLHYSWRPVNPLYPRKVIETGTPIYDEFTPNTGGDLNRKQYIDNGHIEDVNIFHWELIDNNIGLKQGNILDLFGNVVDIKVLFNKNVGLIQVKVPLIEKDTELEKQKIFRIEKAIKGFLSPKYKLVLLRKYI